MIYCEFCESPIFEPKPKQKFCTEICRNEKHRQARILGELKINSKPIHARNYLVNKSLQRVANLLADGKERTRKEIREATGVEAVGTVCSELRANKFEIDCTRRGTYGNYLWYYKMIGGQTNLLRIIK